MSKYRHLIVSRGLLAKGRESDGRPARGFYLVGPASDPAGLWSGHLCEVLLGHQFLTTAPFKGYERDPFPSFVHALHASMALPISVEQMILETALSALGHDLGKSGGEFQDMLYSLEEFPDTRPAQQAYRHEFLSFLILTRHPDICQWFQAAAGSMAAYRRVVAGAMGHHMKTELSRALGGLQRLSAEDPDAAHRLAHRPHPIYLRMMTSRMDALRKKFLPALPSFPTVADIDLKALLDISSVTHGNVQRVVEDIHLSRDWRGIENDATASAVKWVTILADVLGSISDLPGETARETRDRIYGPLRKAFARVPQVDYIQRMRNKLRLERGREVELRGFQQECITERNLVATASTGGGKTIAALAWASARPDLKLILTTPTQDTATRLFDDYAELGEDKLRHDSAWLHVMQLQLPADRDDSTVRQESAEDAVGMLALKNIDDEITFTTADQVLGATAFYRKAIMWLPALLSAQIVFDEVHSFDPRMQGYYHQFLAWFPNIRTAHLSATLVETKQTTLVRHLGDPRIVQDSRKEGAPRMRPRYRLHVIPAQEAPEHFTAGTLWVTNVVAQCQEVGRLFPTSHAYHSRFRAKDRKTIRDRVVSAFAIPAELRGTSAASHFRPTARVVGTQVVEMSLDISAYQMITEICPPEAFIQRLGRVLRVENNERVADIYVYLPERDHGFPYATGDDWAQVYDAWLGWVQGLTGRDLSQHDLEEAMQAFYRRVGATGATAPVRQLIHETTRMSIRDSINSVKCLLSIDATRIRALGGRDKALEISACAIPTVPNENLRELMQDQRNFLDYHLVIQATYDQRLGLTS